MKNRPFLGRLCFAMFGMVVAWRRERSFRTQVMIGLAAAVFTAILRA
jgi:diacylglycerol kinase